MSLLGSLDFQWFEWILEPLRVGRILVCALHFVDIDSFADTLLDMHSV